MGRMRTRPPASAAARPRVRCVGAVVRDESGRLLLVLRGREPAVGTWSLPGGRVEVGETDAEALRRELAEETGLDVVPGAEVGTVLRDGGGGVTYEIHDYACDVAAGSLVAGDDAAEARWVAAADVRLLPCAPGLVETLTSWGVLGE
ncbi:MAG: hydrolase [Nocardioidaceae bacterium]|nr:hydrolase [Nocardioidaceae bacterium]